MSDTVQERIASMKNQENEYSDYKTLNIPAFLSETQKQKEKIQNILILALSTFHYNQKTKRVEVSDATYTVRNNKAAGEYHGAYQLEPIPKYLEKTLQAQKQHLDEIIVLCSKKSQDKMKPGNGVVINNAYISECSPLDYFVFALNQADEFNGHTPFYYIVKTEDDSEHPLLADAMSSALAEVRRNEQARVYVDIHGGLRDAQQIINGLLSLLKVEGRNIEPDNIYSVVIPGNADKGEIVDAGETLRLYDFISGINELMNYGRIDSLDNYENRTSTADEEKALIRELRNIAESIQLNNIRGFEDALDRLPGKINRCKQSEQKSFLNLYLSDIEENYKSIMGSNRTILNEIRWSLNHGFYQQVLTLIESRIPDYFIDNDWLDFDRDAMDLAAENRNRRRSEEALTRERKQKIFNICVPNIIKRKRTAPLERGMAGYDLMASIPDSHTIRSNGTGRNLFEGYTISVDDSLKEIIRLHIAFKELRNECNHSEMQHFANISMKLFNKQVKKYCAMLSVLSRNTASEKPKVHVKAPGVCR